MKYTDGLSKFSANLKFENLPEGIIERMKWVILDATGCIAGAATTEAGRYYADYIKAFEDKEEATVFGFPFRTSIRSAAYANGTLAEMLEYQDGYTKGGVHPASSVIPSVFSVSEHLDLSGEEVITALVAGYEVTNRISEAIHPGHLSKGFQPTGTVGAIGSAVAVGKLLGFDAEKMKNAIGIAAFTLPISVGDNLWGRYSIKPLHGGLAARCGVESAYLAALGISGCPLEGEASLRRGFCSITCDEPDMDKIINNLGEKYTIDELYFKPYSCCRQLHSAIDVALDLMEKEGFGYEDIERIVARTDDFTSKIPGIVKTDINSSIVDCQFSLKYAIAVAFIYEKVGLQQYSDETRANKEVHDLAAKIEVVADEELQKMRPANRPSILEVSLKDGRRFTGRTDFPRGDFRSPLSKDDLYLKFDKLITSSLGANKTETLYEQIMSIEKIRMKQFVQQFSTSI